MCTELGIHHAKCTQKAGEIFHLLISKQKLVNQSRVDFPCLLSWIRQRIRTLMIVVTKF